MSDRDPNEIPADFRVLTDELTPEKWEQLKKLQAVMVKAQADGILCTGRPDLLECPNPPFTIIVLHGSAFALPCIDCVQPVGRALFRAGHASFRQVPLSDSKPENLKPFALHRRKVNADAGQFVVPEGRRRR